MSRRKASKKGKSEAKAQGTKQTKTEKPKAAKPKADVSDLKKLARLCNKLDRIKQQSGLPKKQAEQKADEKFAKRQEKLEAKIEDFNENGTERLNKLVERKERTMERAAKLEEQIETYQDGPKKWQAKLDEAKAKYVKGLMNPADSDKVEELENEISDLLEICNIGSAS